MLAIRDYQSEIRRFQGSQKPRRGIRSMGQIDQLTGTNTTDNVDTNWASTLDSNPYTPGMTTGLTSSDINFNTPSTFPNNSGASGPSFTTQLSGLLNTLAPIGAVVARNLTMPYSTYSQVTPYGTTTISQPAGTVSPGMAFGGTGLSSLMSGGMMPILLVGVVVLMFASRGK
jgi:hypothetical protein